MILFKLCRCVISILYTTQKLFIEMLHILQTVLFKIWWRQSISKDRTAMIMEKKKVSINTTENWVTFSYSFRKVMEELRIHIGTLVHGQSMFILLEWKVALIWAVLTEKCDSEISVINFIVNHTVSISSSTLERINRVPRGSDVSVSIGTFKITIDNVIILWPS